MPTAEIAANPVAERNCVHEAARAGALGAGMWGGGSAAVQFAAQQLQPSLRAVPPVIRAASIVIPALFAFAWYANSEMNACARRAFWAERG